MNILEQLSKKTRLSFREIDKIIKVAPYRYKVFKIEKKNNKGFRIIAQPARPLKRIQKLLLSIIKDYAPIHEAATAYIDNKNILDNAKRHVDNEYLLKMDFSDFFHSIKPSDLEFVLRKNEAPFSDLDYKLMANAFFWKTRHSDELKLSIGAPSSPFISNAVMYDFDCAVSMYCSEHNITYTRYADDLTFSTKIKNTLREVPTFVNKLTIKNQHPRLRINTQKTVFASKASNRHITGIVLSNNNTTSIGREKRRKIKLLLHLYSQKRLPAEEISTLHGYLSFLSDVDEKYYQYLLKKYQAEINSLKEQNQQGNFTCQKE